MEKEGTLQSNVGVPIPGCGTWGHESVVALAVLGACLASMVLELCSSLNDSVIP